VIRARPRARVALKKALGKNAVKEPKFNFHGTTSDQTKFQQTAYVLENTGVHAYLGQAGNIKTPAYLLAAASIVAIEARHDAGLPASAILKAVKGTKFIV
jgi:hypothetical protein